MSNPADPHAQARNRRNAARAAFDRRLAQVRGDLMAHGLGGRIKDTVSLGARDALNEVIDIADSQKGVVAGTMAALLLWFMRHPILAWLSDSLGMEDEETAGDR